MFVAEPSRVIKQSQSQSQAADESAPRYPVFGNNFSEVLVDEGLDQQDNKSIALLLFKHGAGGSAGKPLRAETVRLWKLGQSRPREVLNSQLKNCREIHWPRNHSARAICFTETKPAIDANR